MAILAKQITDKMPVPRRVFVSGPAALALGRTPFGPTEQVGVCSRSCSHAKGG
jgi:hypothetical protein